MSPPPLLPFVVSAFLSALLALALALDLFVFVSRTSNDQQDECHMLELDKSEALKM